MELPSDQYKGLQILRTLIVAWDVQVALHQLTETVVPGNIMNDLESHVPSGLESFSVGPTNFFRI